MSVCIFGLYVFLVYGICFTAVAGTQASKCNFSAKGVSVSCWQKSMAPFWLCGTWPLGKDACGLANKMASAATNWSPVPLRVHQYCLSY